MCFSENVGRHFLKSNNVGRHLCPDFQGFCPYFQGSCSDFDGFCPGFQQIKTFGVRLRPHLLHHCFYYNFNRCIKLLEKYGGLPATAKCESM